MLLEIHPIRTDADYRAALSQVNRLFEAAEATAEADTLEVLVMLIEQWEAHHYPIALPTPISAIEFTLEQRGVGREALLSLLGTPARVSEVLNGQRKLTLRMIRWLHTELGIPLPVLVQDYPLNHARVERGRPRRDRHVSAVPGG
jgi:HTH-type transcriptional regulator/antitoxin HigA